MCNELSYYNKCCLRSYCMCSNHTRRQTLSPFFLKHTYHNIFVLPCKWRTLNHQGTTRFYYCNCQSSDRNAVDILRGSNKFSRFIFHRVSICIYIYLRRLCRQTISLCEFCWQRYPISAFSSLHIDDLWRDVCHRMSFLLSYGLVRNTKKFLLLIRMNSVDTFTKSIAVVFI